MTLANADPSQVHVLGPGQITLDGLDMGFVSKVELDLTAEQLALLVAAYGKAPVGFIRLGEEAKITCAFQQVNTTNYAKVIQGATRNTSGSASNISSGAYGGTRMTPMLFTYVPLDSTLSAFSLTAWKVTPGPNTKIMLNEQQQDLAVEFLPAIDHSKADGFKMWAFGDITVVPDAVAATATYSPADDATGVAVAVAPTITFNKAMDPATLIGANIQMFAALDVGAQTPIAGVVSVNAAGTVATFTPNSSLSGSTAYNIIVSSGCKSASGVAFAGAKTSFTTV